MSRFDPTRGELKFRLAVSVAGLIFMGTAVAIRGLPSGPAFIEVIGVAGFFFGGTAIWSARKLIKGEHSDGL
jgi:hypothetical protein